MSSGRVPGRPGWDARAEATTSPHISSPQHVPLEGGPPGCEDVAWWGECYPEEISWIPGAEQATAHPPRDSSWLRAAAHIRGTGIDWDHSGAPRDGSAARLVAGRTARHHPAVE